MFTPKEHQICVCNYYDEAKSAYRNWGLDLSRKGIYGAHMGLDESEDHHDHYESVARLTSEVIAISTICNGQKVLDAGCGVGSVSFEIASRYPEASVIGINISKSQLATAQSFKNQSSWNNLFFLENDYLGMSLNTSVFDRIIYCESYTHASDKKKLLAEAKRILTPNGKVILFDAFDSRTSTDPTEEKLVKDLEEGWFLPGIPKLNQFVNWAKNVGFKQIQSTNYSNRVIVSARLMGDHAEQKMTEEPRPSDTIMKSRLACIATRDLMMRGAMDYYAIELS
jgi:ubiquinone/menaquinone biosynthesis C-methylase UbiE